MKNRRKRSPTLVKNQLKRTRRRRKSPTQIVKTRLKRTRRRRGRKGLIETLKNLRGKSPTRIMENQQRRVRRRKKNLTRRYSLSNLPNSQHRTSTLQKLISRNFARMDSPLLITF
jgi:hypothetical protein